MNEQEKQRLLERTWDALQHFELDCSCSLSVNRYDKLVKLYLSLSKQLAKDNEPSEPDLKSQLDWELR